MTKKRDNRVGVKAAKITVLGAVVAAVIGGLFLILNALLSQKSAGPDTRRVQVTAGRDVFYGENQYVYIQDKYIMDGVMRQGWFGHGPPKDELLIDDPSLRIFPLGLANHRLGFLLASGERAQCKVELLYLKLEAYAKCDLRDETTRMLAFMGQVSSHFYISERHEVYPIYPAQENLVRGSWIYQGRDVDEFRVLLTFEPYVLYLISVNVDYVDLRTGDKKHAQSDEFALIDVARGNWGGCLDVTRWYSKDLRQKPATVRYDECIPHDIYLLLTADFAYDPGLMNIFVENSFLRLRRPEVEQIVASRSNPVFDENLKMWIAALEKGR
jgi:hypothetical protein